MPEPFLIPRYTADIVERLRANSWLAHNFRTSDPDEIYNPANYLLNIERKKYSYVVVLDLNIFQYLLNACSTRTPRHEYRTAAALLCFCQIAQIKTEPALALYERISYNKENVHQVVRQLNTFKAIDNAHPTDIANYALGLSNTISLNKCNDLDPNTIAAELTKYRRLVEWDSLYLTVLSIVDINIDQRIPTKQKLDAFIDWSIREFQLCAPAVVYAVRLFGNYPIRSMMKAKQNYAERQMRAAVNNMTWDLYLINYYVRQWQKKSEHTQILVASADKALRDILSLTITLFDTGEMNSIKPFVRPESWTVLSTRLRNIDQENHRAYTTIESWDPYRQQLISALEEKLYRPTGNP